jgi:tRNA-dihydrouridine synthase C
LMLGRGMVQNPALARAIHAQAEGVQNAAPALDWASLLTLIDDYWALVSKQLDKKSRTGRLKQWLNFLRRTYPEAETVYQEFRTCNDPERMDAWLMQIKLNAQKSL